MQDVTNNQLYFMLNSSNKDYSKLIFMDSLDYVGDPLFKNSGILEEMADNILLFLSYNNPKHNKAQT